MMYRFRRLVLLMLLVAIGQRSVGQVIWTSATGTSWLLTGNWSGGVVPGPADVAQFNNLPSSGTTGIGVNMDTASGAVSVGAIYVSSSRTNPLIIGNSAPSTAGILFLTGDTVLGIPNVAVANVASSGARLTFQNTQGAGGSTMDVNLGSTAKTMMTGQGSPSNVGNTILINCRLNGSGGLQFLGGGTWSAYTGTGNNGGVLRLAGNNILSGGMAVGNSDSTSAGILQLDSAGAWYNSAGNDIVIYNNSQLHLAAPSGSVYNASAYHLYLGGLGSNYSSTGRGALTNQNGNSYTWRGPVDIFSDAAINVVGTTSVTLTIDSPVSGNGQLIKLGTGTLQLNGRCTWAGGTEINAGRIVIGVNGSLPNGPLAMNQQVQSPSVVLNNAVQTITELSSTITSTTVSNTLVLSGTRLLLNQAANTTFGGPASNQTSVITGTGSLVKAGSGVLTLTSNGNSFSGGLKVNAGAVKINIAYGSSTTLPSADTLNGGMISTDGITRGFTVNLGTLALTDNSTIEFSDDTSNSIKFAASAGIGWTAGKLLTVTNWQGGYNGTAGRYGRLFFGTTSSGLSSAQLAQIRFRDAGGNLYLATQLTSGEVVPAAPIITTIATSYGPYCANVPNIISVGFTATGPFTAPFLVQLSDNAGVFPADFSSNIIGSGTSSPIAATIPAGILSGTAYRVRVIDSAPTPTFGTNNGSNITITGTPVVNAISGAVIVAAGTSSAYTNSTAGGSWSVSNTLVGTITGTGVFSAFALGVDTIFYTYTNSCGLSATVNLVVTVVQLPVIRGLSTNKGIPGNAITIYGAGFNSSASANAVYFGGQRAAVLSGSSTALSVTLPSGAQYAPVTVTDTISGLSAQSDTMFTPYYDTAGLISGVYNFKPRVNFATGTAPVGILQGDVDGDGFADIVVLNSGPNSAYVYRNNGTSYSINNATFGSPVVLTTGVGPHFGKLADLDGDGRLDLIVANATFSSPKISVFKNNSAIGSISFSPKIDVSAGGASPMDIAIADLDGDGRQDIAVVCQGSDKLALLRNNNVRGAITASGFATPVLLTTGSYPYRIVAADLDADGMPDLAVDNYLGNSLSIFHNAATAGTLTAGSFSSPFTIAGITSPSGIVAADIDGDLRPDLVVPGGTTNLVTIFRNTNATAGTLSFGSGVSFAVGAGPEDVTVADFDGDTRPDFAVANYTANTITLHRNTSTPGTLSVASAAAPFVLGTGYHPAGINSGDLDGDGKPEIVMVNGGDNTFSVFKNYPLPPIGPISGPSAICRGTVASFTNTVAGGTWRSSNTTVGTITSAGVYTGLGYGTDTITYYMIAQHDTNVVSVVVRVDTFTTVGPITATGSNVCVGAILGLHNSVANGIWISADTSVASIDTAGFVRGRAVGAIVVTYSYTNSCGTTTDTMLITVNPSTGYTMGPVSGVSALCSGSAYTFTDTTSGGAWSSGNTAVATVNAGGLVTGVGYGSAIITYGFTGSCGSYIAIASVSIDTLIVLDTISGPETICYGSSATYINTSSVPGLWSTAVGNVTIAGTGLATAVSAGTDTIVYTVTNICGSVRSAKPVIIGSMPAAGVITGLDSVCVADTITLYSTVMGGSWLAVNNRAVINATGRLIGARVGLDTILYIAANACGADTASYIVYVKGLPFPGVISGSSTLCIGASITLRDTVSGGIWSVLHGYLSITDSVATGISAGVDSVFYTVTNACGSSVAVKKITVSNYPMVDTISGPSSVCMGNSITLTNATIGGVWSRTNTRATVTSAGVVTGVAAGIDTIIYTVTAGGCASAASKEITIISNTAGTITSASSVCVADSVILRSTVAGGVWSTTGHGSILADSVLIGQAPGLDTITYVVSSTCGTVSATKKITINPLPDAGEIAGALQLGVGDTVIFRSSITGGIWALVNTNAVIAANGVVGGLREGRDTAFYIVTNGCGKDTAFYPFSVLYSVKPGTITDIKLMPSPSNGNFSFNVVAKQNEAITVVIADAGYRVLNLFQAATNVDVPVALDNIADGVYFLSAISDEGWYTVKFVIAK